MIPDDIFESRQRLKQRKRWENQLDPYTWAILYYACRDAAEAAQRKIDGFPLEVRLGAHVTPADRRRELRLWKNSLREFKRISVVLARIGNSHNWQ